MWDFEKSGFKVSYSLVLDSKGCRKCKNFCGKIVWKSVRNYMDLKEDIFMYVKKQISQNRLMSHFSPPCQIQLPISQNRPVRLAPCFVGVHHKYGIHLFITYLLKINLHSSAPASAILGLGWLISFKPLHRISLLDVAGNAGDDGRTDG